MPMLVMRIGVMIVVVCHGFVMMGMSVSNAGSDWVRMFVLMVRIVRVQMLVVNARVRVFVRVSLRQV